ncbi:MAG TPA: hypothetical protein VES64_00075 [Allosphingosinicella sp.]|nr:hypothetical protein [Allosphingosinicella sp.]
MDSMITIVAPIKASDFDELNARLDALDNPARAEIKTALDVLDANGHGTHFMSLNAIPGNDGEDGHLVFEFTADGEAAAAIKRIDAAIGDALKTAFSMARDWRDNVGLATYLDRHRIKVGAGYFDPPGLNFAGTPGMSVKRIRDEAALAKFVGGLIDNGEADMRPIDRLARVRAEVADSEFAWALKPPPPPLREGADKSVAQAAAGFVPDFVSNYLWPFALVLVAALVLATVLIQPYPIIGLSALAREMLKVLAFGFGGILLLLAVGLAFAKLGARFGVVLVVALVAATLLIEPPPGWNLLPAAWERFKVLALGLGITLAVLLLLVGIVYAKLRAQEATDWVDGRALDGAIFLEMRKRENHCAQNHMMSITERKPGFVRWLTLRLAFWIIGMMASRVFPPGFLGGISTIHAARWITIPGTRTLIFFSNYGGSWESYLEDFITKAHEGLTAVWSNSIGFPRASNLVQGGATDGERFKRYARHSMAPTRFWYSAYPHHTTDHVRCNAVLRRGLAAALTNDEAAQWLALFGSASRPDAKLETSQIQSLVFGGLGFMKDGVCLLYDLPDDKERARAFMAGVCPDVGFGDGRKLRRPAVVTVALGAPALEKLGLPDECVKGFPAAFLEGMSIEGRTRILGDTGPNAPENWQWGRDPHDLALLVYGYNMGAVRALEGRIAARADENGMAPPHRIPLVQTRKPAIEPFGFVDGISQPIVRGSYQSYRKTDPIHLVEPGEFIIGYPDNRGNFPPEPELSPLLDPENRLPVADKSRAFGNTIVEAPRAIGRNGTFLVIRQLEQDVDAFEAYCEEEAERVEPRLPVPYQVTKDFIAAKLVGRWPDGSSLVRNPYYPYPKEQEERQKRRDNRPTAKGFDEASALTASGEPIGSETVRPDTKPSEGTAISTSAEPAAGVTRAEPAHRGDNDFLYGTEDPQALRCPFGAHIRRANPRDSLMPGSMEQVSISNRHRIYRVGRLYEPEAGGKPGLLFMCLNGDIERQFEFIQQTWLVSPAFHGLVGEQDPLTSDGGETSATCFMVPSNDGPVRLKPLPRFVKTLGGGYFFMPSRSVLAYLGGL